jgi:hypothetical protein
VRRTAVGLLLAGALLAGCDGGQILDTSGLTQVDISYVPGDAPCGGQWSATLISPASLHEFADLVASHGVGVTATPNATCTGAASYSMVLIRGDSRTSIDETECPSPSGDLSGDVSGFLGALTSGFGPSACALAEGPAGA